MTDNLNILIADDHELIRDALVLALRQDETFELIPASNYDETEAILTKRTDIDIVMLDVVMPGMQGRASLEAILSIAGQAKVVLFSGNVTRDFLSEALGCGCAGLIPKDLRLSSLGSVLKLIASGVPFVPAQLGVNTTFCSQGNSAAQLSERDVTILRMVSEGRTNKEIAWHLGLADVTIKYNMRNICEKLQAKNRAQAVNNARTSGII